MRDGEFFSFGRIVPGLAGDSDEIGDNRDLGIDLFCAGFIPHLEAANQRNIHAANESNFSGPAGQGRDGTDEVSAFVLLEHEAADIGGVHLGVHDRKMFLWKLGGDFFDRFLLGEPDADDEIEITFRKSLEHRLEGVVIGGFDVFEKNAELILSLSGAFVSGGVERFVVLAAAIEHEADPEFGGGKMERQEN